jgi:hypothetical protein
MDISYWERRFVLDNISSPFHPPVTGWRPQFLFNEFSSISFKKGVIKMNSIKKIAEKMDTKVLLSTLWIVVMINMLKAYILSLYIPGALDEVAKTSVSTGTPIPQLMLGGAIMMEMSIVMIILSRVLKYRANRWVNFITSITTIAFVVGSGATYPHYIFIATVEVVCLLLIVWFSWKWTNPEG